MAELPGCAKAIFKNGEHVFTTHSIGCDDIEKWVKKIAKKSGQKVDWHYFGGRAVVKALGDIDKVKKAIEELMPEHDRLFKRAFDRDR